jgi:hypothetical protein
VVEVGKKCHQLKALSGKDSTSSQSTFAQLTSSPPPGNSIRFPSSPRLSSEPSLAPSTPSAFANVIRAEKRESPRSVIQSGSRRARESSNRNDECCFASSLIADRSKRHPTTRREAIFIILFVIFRAHEKRGEENVKLQQHFFAFLSLCHHSQSARGPPSVSSPT